MKVVLTKYSFLLLIPVLGAYLVSCSAKDNDPGKEYAPNMYHSVAYEPLKQITDKDAGNWVSSLDNGVGEYYSSNPNNPFEMNMRVPPPNTVPRNDNGFIPYKIHKDSLITAALVKSPLDSTKAIVDQGKILYGRYCQHCHGNKGMGDGLVGQVYLGIPAYNTPAIKDKSEGHIFHVITMGKGRMNAHASQVSVTDRWKIVRYVQTLQKQ